MANSMDTHVITLKEALLRWTDPTLIEKVRVHEAGFTAHAMTAVKHLPRFCTDEELATPSNDSWMSGRPNFKLLLAAHEQLERDFRDRVVRGEFHLRGVLTRPALTTGLRNIPGAWISEGHLDFIANCFSIADQRFVAVVASRDYREDLAAELSANHQSPLPTDGRTVPPITDANIRSLSDDEVLLLLEDHARRVVESPDARLIAPGRISLMPILRRKMRHRHEHNESRETLAAEAQALADWIATKVPSHQVPTPDSIKNGLRSYYRPPKT